MPEIIVNSVGMKFVRVVIGSDQQVIYFSQFLMSNAEFQKITGKSPPWWSGTDSDGPVIRLNWFDARELSKILTELPAEKSAGRHYRLPTQAEWQQVCSAGTTTRFFFGDSEKDLPKFAHIGSDDSFCKSGQFLPNPLGIYDLYGNLWEWCLDSRIDRDNASVDLNDLHPDNLCGLCGGAWCTSAGEISSLLRDMQHPSVERSTIGVRLVFTVNISCPSSISIQPISIENTLDDRRLINSIGMSLSPIPTKHLVVSEVPNGSVRNTIWNRKEDAEYYIGTFPVTESEFRLLLNGGSYACNDNYSFQTDLHRVAVTEVSWTEANEYCERLSQIPNERDAGRRYRLPTEYEWEYCCLCGESSDAISYECSKITAWTQENTRRNTRPPVGLKAPNLWGLHDMLGGVSEWCSNYYFSRDQLTGEGPLDPYCRRVARGGNVYFPRSLCQPNSRFAVSPDHKSFYVGFRLLMYIER